MNKEMKQKILFLCLRASHYTTNRFALMFFSTTTSTDKTWIETNITNVMSIREPSHETIETETITTMRKCSVLALQNENVNEIIDVIEKKFYTIKSNHLLSFFSKIYLIR